MKSLVLRDVQIVVPDKEVGNEQILKIYFRLFNLGHGDCVPPVVVAHKSKIDPGYMRENFGDRDRVEGQRFYQRLMCYPSDYLLLDGVCRCCAAAFCHQQIKSLLLENDSDIRNLHSMVDEGELIDFRHCCTSLTKMANKFVDSLYLARTIINLEEKVEELAKSSMIPSYMVERFRNEMVNGTE